MGGMGRRTGLKVEADGETEWAAALHISTSTSMHKPPSPSGLSHTMQIRA